MVGMSHDWQYCDVGIMASLPSSHVAGIVWNKYGCILITTNTILIFDSCRWLACFSLLLIAPWSQCYSIVTNISFIAHCLYLHHTIGIITNVTQKKSGCQLISASPIWCVPYIDNWHDVCNPCLSHGISNMVSLLASQHCLKQKRLSVDSCLSDFDLWPM